MKALPNLEASGALAIAECLSRISGGRVLDVGTGKGNFIEALMKALESYDNFIGIDVTSKDLEKAQETFQKQPVQFMEMDANHLGFADASFDTVCIANSLHHLANVPKVLSEMNRVLKPGGHFLVEEMYRDGKQTDAQHTDILEHHWTAKIDRVQGITHHETMTQNQIVNMLEALRFTNLEVLDSSRRVYCLFCSQRFECEDPKSESIIASFLKGMDKTLDRLKSSERLPEIVAEAEKLKLRAKETGVASASIFFVVGRK
ncbi:MAG: class I SAM-dependent methyltransferase [Promethearchaeota archaeon]